MSGFYRNVLRNACLANIVFLCVACNQNLKQNTDYKQENVPPAAQETITLSSKLQDKKNPALIYGSNPAYMVVEKDGDDWACKFVEDSSLEDPGIVDQTFKMSGRTGLLSDQNRINPYGLYFGEIPALTKTSICGTSQCRPITKQTVLVINTKPEEFEKLYASASAFNANQIEIKEWNLYFFDTDLQSFQSSSQAILSIVKDGDHNITVLDWNGVLDQTGKATLSPDETSSFKIKSDEIEHPVIVGKYKNDDKEYRVIGIEKLTFVNSE